MTDEELGHVLKALADPNRRRMLELLAAEEAAAGDTAPGCGISCSVINRQLSIAQPTVSHHVKELVAARLIHYEAVGNTAQLSVNRETFAELFAALRERFHLD